MAKSSKTKQRSYSDDNGMEQAPTNINPYKVLSVEKTATDAEIRKAYRHLALVNHPDKVAADERDKAHVVFQEIVFAYGVLSDPSRRKLYDTTGSLEETLNEFKWKDYFDQMYSKAVTKEMIEEDKHEYRESGQERADILKYYVQSKGSIDYIFENVIHSEILQDEERFRKIIDDAIQKKEVKAYRAYTNESKSSKSNRKKIAKREEIEANELAKELDVSNAVRGSEDDLAALIKHKNGVRMESFFENLENKYASKRKSKTAERRPSEDEFQAIQKKLKK
ncbi:hypothetical protein V1511DRAFT_493981 [Dipodascopsis uninucleata]